MAENTAQVQDALVSEAGRVLSAADPETPGLLQTALDVHGAAVVTGAFAPGEIAGFHDEVTALFERIAGEDEATLAADLGIEADELREARRTGGLASTSFSHAVFGDPDRFNLLVAAKLAAPPMLDMLRTVMGPGIRVGARKATVRYRDPQAPGNALPFHQDGANFDDRALFRSPDPAMLTLWVPFAACDGTRPGIEFVDGAPPDILPPVAEPATLYGAIESDLSGLPEAARRVWSPRLAVGDVAIFTERTLHRSAVDAAMRLPRTSLDIRVFTPARTPPAMRTYPAYRLPDLAPVTLGDDGPDPAVRRAEVGRLMAAGAYAEAKTILDGLVALSPRSDAWRFLRGNASFRLGRFADAVADYSAGLEASPGNAPMLIQRGLARARLGDPAGAHTDIDEAERNGGDRDSVARAREALARDG